MPDNIYDQTLKQLHFVEQRANGLAEDLINTLQDSLQNVVAKISELQARLLLNDYQNESQQKQLEYLQIQRQEIEKIISQVYSGMKEPLQETAQDVMQYVGKATVKNLSLLVPVTLSVPLLNLDVVKKWFEMTTVENLVITEWLDKLEKNAAERIIKAGRQAMIENMTIPQTMRFMKKEGIDGSIPALEGLSRTFCMSAANYAKEQTMLHNFGDSITQWQYIATLDDRTCPICGVDDLKIFNVNDSKRPALPRHWRCRCTYIPKGKYQELFNNLPQDKEATLDFIKDGNFKHTKEIEDFSEFVKEHGTRYRYTAKHKTKLVKHRDGSKSIKLQTDKVTFVTDTTNYNTWLKSQLTSDPEFVKRVLGKTRFELFKAGKITLNQMVTHGKLKKLSDLI